jgi:dipeptidyl aminopeptidase/acylaminoacyl peptidase
MLTVRDLPRGMILDRLTGLPGTVLEMVWSPSGATLAVVPTGSTFGGAIYLVTGTSATPLLTVPSGDNVRDLTWSPDDEWIVYRRTRGSLSWFELLDVDAGVLTAPLAVTWTWPAGNASSYRSVMSLSPVWGNGDQLWMPSFGLTLSAEPGILTVNLAGAVQ